MKKLFFALIALIAITLVYSNVKGSVNDLPDGIDYPIVTVSDNTCGFTEFYIGYWEIDSELWGDEWSQTIEITRVQNGTLDTVNADDTFVYGAGYWYMTHGTSLVTVEFTTKLYRVENDNPSYIYTSSFNVEHNPECDNVGTIDNLYFVETKNTANYIIQQVYAKDTNEYMATIALHGNGVWSIDELVDFTYRGELHSNAIENYADTLVNLLNGNGQYTTFLPLVTK